ncbi:hypothetical protein PFISCL1PPCAC_10970, partial [Pristionchus fissidentatus]
QIVFPPRLNHCFPGPEHMFKTDAPPLPPVVKTFEFYSGFAWNVISLVVSVVLLVFGAVNIDTCPAQPKIPIYLIVSGALNICGFPIQFYIYWKKFKARPEKFKTPKILAVLELAISGIELIWLILGVIWTFGTDPVYEIGNPNYCNFWTYFVAYASFILLLASILFLCCCGTCLLCGVMCFQAMKEVIEEEEEKEKREAAGATDNTGAN